jgi:hypothetical protein
MKGGVTLLEEEEKINHVEIWGTSFIRRIHPPRPQQQDDDDGSRFTHAPTPSLLVAHVVDATRSGDDDGSSGGLMGRQLNPPETSSRSASSRATMIFIVSVMSL